MCFWVHPSEVTLTTVNELTTFNRPKATIVDKGYELLEEV